MRLPPVDDDHNHCSAWRKRGAVDWRRTEPGRFHLKIVPILMLLVLLLLLVSTPTNIADRVKTMRECAVRPHDCRIIAMQFSTAEVVQSCVVVVPVVL